MGTHLRLQAEDQAESSTDSGDTVQRGGMGGPVFSSLVMNEEGGEEEGLVSAHSFTLYAVSYT